LSAFFSCSRTIPAHKSLMNSSCIQVFSQNNNRSVNSLKCVHDQFACNQPIWTDWVVLKTKFKSIFHLSTTWCILCTDPRVLKLWEKSAAPSGITLVCRILQFEHDGFWLQQEALNFIA
jgi:hypothetical protein